MPEPGDPLARYLRRRKGDFSREHNRVKTNAFLPDMDEGDHRHKTSVFETLNLSEREIVELGREWVTTPAGHYPYGYAEILVASVSACGLHLEDSNPPPRHFNICGWLAGPDDSLRLNIAQKLAVTARLHLDPTRESDLAH